MYFHHQSSLFIIDNWEGFLQIIDSFRKIFVNNWDSHNALIPPMLIPLIAVPVSAHLGWLAVLGQLEPGRADAGDGVSSVHLLLHSRGSQWGRVSKWELLNYFNSQLTEFSLDTARKICTESGWFRDNNTAEEWTDYSGCDKTDDTITMEHIR